MSRRSRERHPCPVHPWILLAERETCPELGERCGGREIMRSVRVPGVRALTAAAMRRRRFNVMTIAKWLKCSPEEVPSLAHLGERALRWVEGKTIEDIL